MIDVSRQPIEEAITTTIRYPTRKKNSRLESLLAQRSFINLVIPYSLDLEAAVAVLKGKTTQD
jgi:hypothetical protein